MRRSAFTLAELMVVLAVIGVIIAIITPTVVKLKPNESKIMFKKAYYIVERVVNELINDDTVYSDSDDDAPGFVDEGNTTLYGNVISGNTKFCKLFVSKVNTNGTPDCDTASLSTPIPGGTGSGNFKTNDGLTWHIPITPNAAAVAQGYKTLFTNPNLTMPAPAGGSTQKIIVDINGTGPISDSNPNCVYDVATCPNPDQFTIIVQYDGKIMIVGFKEHEYLKDSSIR